MPEYYNSEVCSKTGDVHRVIIESKWYTIGASGQRESGVNPPPDCTIKRGAKCVQKVRSDEIPFSEKEFDDDAYLARIYADELMAQMLKDCDGTHRDPL